MSLDCDLETLVLHIDLVQQRIQCLIEKHPADLQTGILISLLVSLLGLHLDLLRYTSEHQTLYHPLLPTMTLTVGQIQKYLDRLPS